MVILGEDAANPFSIDPFFHLGRKINILYQETIFIFERRVWKCSIMRVECSDALCPSFVYTPHLCHKLLWEVSSRTIETDMSAAHWLSDKPLGNPNVEFSIKWETETRLPPLCRRAGECAAGWETRRTATDDEDTVSMQHIVCGAARVCVRACERERALTAPSKTRGHWLRTAQNAEVIAGWWRAPLTETKKKTN